MIELWNFDVFHAGPANPCIVPAYRDERSTQAVRQVNDLNVSSWHRNQSIPRLTICRDLVK